MGKVKHVNIRNSILTCAFCTHWYDPANSHIKPVDQFLGNWDCDMDVKSCCDVIHKQTLSQNNCTHFERKIPKP